MTISCSRWKWMGLPKVGSWWMAVDVIEFNSRRLAPRRDGVDSNGTISGRSRPLQPGLRTPFDIVSTAVGEAWMTFQQSAGMSAGPRFTSSVTHSQSTAVIFEEHDDGRTPPTVSLSTAFRTDPQRSLNCYQRPLGRPVIPRSPVDSVKSDGLPLRRPICRVEREPVPRSLRRVAARCRNFM